MLFKLFRYVRTSLTYKTVIKAKNTLCCIKLAAWCLISSSSWYLSINSLKFLCVLDISTAFRITAIVREIAIAPNITKLQKIMLWIKEIKISFKCLAWLIKHVLSYLQINFLLKCSSLLEINFGGLSCFVQLNVKFTHVKYGNE